MGKDEFQAPFEPKPSNDFMNSGFTGNEINSLVASPRRFSLNHPEHEALLGRVSWLPFSTTTPHQGLEKIIREFFINSGRVKDKEENHQRIFLLILAG